MCGCTGGYRAGKNTSRGGGAEIFSRSSPQFRETGARTSWAGSAPSGRGDTYGANSMDGKLHNKRGPCDSRPIEPPVLVVLSYQTNLAAGGSLPSGECGVKAGPLAPLGRRQGPADGNQAARNKLRDSSCMLRDQMPRQPFPPLTRRSPSLQLERRGGPHAEAGTAVLAPLRRRLVQAEPATGLSRPAADLLPALLACRRGTFATRPKPTAGQFFRREYSRAPSSDFDGYRALHMGAQLSTTSLVPAVR